jgi:hypothetical protein
MARMVLRRGSSPTSFQVLSFGPFGTVGDMKPMTKKRRTDVYELSDDERAAIEDGLRQLDRGEVLSEQDMEPHWKSFGVDRRCAIQPRVG